MRLLLTTDAVGGIWRYSLDLVAGLQRRGVACTLAVLGPAPIPQQLADADGITLVQTGLPLDWTAESPAALAHATSRLVALAALLGADRVLLHAPALVGETHWPCPVVVVAHSCVGTWWRSVRGGALPPDLAWRAAATGAGLRVADAVIAPTRAHAEAVCATYGATRIRVVWNGAADPGAPPRALPDREPAVLAAGRLWDESKGLDLLDAAAASLEAPVRAAGPLKGPNGATIRLAHVVPLSTLDAGGMARAYAGARVFCAPARYEPFGLAVLEAALAGMRLVLWDLPGFRELWDGAAIFVDDAAALPGALRQALEATDDGGARVRGQGYPLDAMVAGTLGVLLDTARVREPVVA